VPLTRDPPGPVPLEPVHLGEPIESMTTQRTPRLRAPRSMTSRLLLGAGLALPVLVAAGCTGSTSGDNSGALYVQTCSLSCTDGQGGAQVFCAIVNVFQNTEISVLFSEALDPASVGPATFQVIDVTNGTSPDGQYLIDPLDPRRAIFRPGIVFGGGGVTFSFRANTSYEVLIPGQAQGDNGPFITSVAGNPNQSRLQCTIFTSEGVTDPVPGNPRVEIDVTRVTGVDMFGNPATFETVTIPPNGPLIDDIWRSSPVVFRFNELMNVATVANNATGTSPFIAVEFDRDGNLATSSSGDRRAIAGRYEFEIDLSTFQTTLVFTPSELYPSAGSNPASPRLIVIRVPTQVVDLTNKSVLTTTGGGTLAAIPEIRSFQSITIPDGDGETFDAAAGAPGSFEDQSHGGANWAAFLGGETVLAPGLTGGSGRLGDVIVAAGEVLELSTDGQSFPLQVGPVLRQVDVVGNATAGEFPFSINVTDGVFEFSSLVVEPGARLVFRGSNPARVLVRGPIVISPGGVLDVSGESSGEHDSLEPLGAVAAPSGAGGGDGGGGADRADFTGTPLLTLPPPPAGTPAIANPGADRNGRSGGGVGGGAFGGGGGGPAYPTLLPVTLVPRANGTDGRVTQNVAFTPDTPENVDCVSLDMGGPGGGGGYAVPGSVGAAVPSVDEPIGEFVPVGASNALRGTPGAAGDNSGLALEPPDLNNTGYVVRLLDWENGHLRGGSGGGGAGNHPYMTRSSGDTLPANCFASFVFDANWTHWHDHSGAAGGGGGGAVELLSGKRIDLDGRIDARGGQGGGSLTGQLVTYFGQYAMAGGGGSGGAVRLRATTVDILPGGTRIDVRGGLGGNAFWAVAAATPTSSRGGDGSQGLVRIEDGISGGAQVTFAGLRALVSPFDSGNPDASLAHLSVAGNFFTGAPVLRPDSVTASSSCWMQPAGGFDSLGLRADTGPDVTEQGWTLNVVVDQAGTIVKRPYRGTSAQFPTSWEQQFGNLLGYDLGVGEVASPIVVRFQGARSGTTLASPCDVDPNNFLGPIDAGSLTRWVSHPSMLNGILNQQNAPLSPNLVRYVIIFDQTNDPANNDTPGQILVAQGVIGVDDLFIVADPE